MINAGLFLFVLIAVVSLSSAVANYDDDERQHGQNDNIIQIILQENYLYPKRREFANDVLFSSCNFQTLSMLLPWQNGSSFITISGYILGGAVFIVDREKDNNSVRFEFIINIPTKGEISTINHFMISDLPFRAALLVSNTVDAKRKIVTPLKVISNCERQEYVGIPLTKINQSSSTIVMTYSCQFSTRGVAKILVSNLDQNPQLSMQLYLPLPEIDPFSGSRWNNKKPLVTVPLCAITDRTTGNTALTALAKLLLDSHRDSKNDRNHFYHNLIGCTQPLKNINRLEKRWPGIIRQWLTHHIYLMGVGQIYIYDSDDSVLPFIEDFVALGLVKYWNATFVRQFALFDDIDQENKADNTNSVPISDDDMLIQIISRDPSLRIAVDNHCLWSAKGKTEWLLSLPSPVFFINDYVLGGKTLFNTLDSLLDVSQSRMQLQIMDHVVRRLHVQHSPTYHNNIDSTATNPLPPNVFSVYPYLPLLTGIANYSVLEIIDPHSTRTASVIASGLMKHNEHYRDLNVYARHYSGALLSLQHQIHPMTSPWQSLVSDTTMEQFHAFHTYAEALHSRLFRLISNTTSPASPDYLDNLTNDSSSQVSEKHFPNKIRLAIIGPGLFPIPPTGQGAVEIIIWNYYLELNKRQHKDSFANRSHIVDDRDFEVFIVNFPNEHQILEEVARLQPDVIHIHIDHWAYLIDHWKYLNCLILVTSHSPFLSNIDKLRQGMYSQSSLSRAALPVEDDEKQSKRLQGYVWGTVVDINAVSIFYRCHEAEKALTNNPNMSTIWFVAIAEKHREILNTVWSIPLDNIIVIPNGVEVEKYQQPLHSKSRYSSFSNSSVSLGTVETRKGQYYVQSLLHPREAYFIGSRGMESMSYPARNIFDFSSPSYLGPWTKHQLYANLSIFGNMVHLASDEGAPLAVLEGLAAGLGVVITKNASANLDTSKPFITIIPDEQLRDKSYVQAEIRRNRAISLEMREEILEYANQELSWSNAIVPLYRRQVNRLLREREVRSKSGYQSVDKPKWLNKYDLVARWTDSITPYSAVVVFFDRASSMVREWVNCLQFVGVELFLFYTFPTIYEETLHPQLKDLIEQGIVEVHYFTDFPYYHDLILTETQIQKVPDDRLFYNLVMNEAVSYLRIRGVRWMANIFEQDYFYEDMTHSSIARNALKFFLKQCDGKKIDIAIIHGDDIVKGDRSVPFEQDRVFTKQETSRTFVRVDQANYYEWMMVCCIGSFRKICKVEHFDANAVINGQTMISPIRLMAPSIDYIWELQAIGRISSTDKEAKKVVNSVIALFPMLSRIYEISQQFVSASDSNRQNSTLIDLSQTRKDLILFVTHFPSIDRHSEVSLLDSPLRTNFLRLTTLLPSDEDYLLLVYTDVNIISYLMNHLLCTDSTVCNTMTVCLPYDTECVCSCVPNIIFINVNTITTIPAVDPYHAPNAPYHTPTCNSTGMINDTSHVIIDTYSHCIDGSTITMSKIDYLSDARKRYPFFSFYTILDIESVYRDGYVPQRIDTSRLLTNKILMAVRIPPDYNTPLNAQNVRENADVLYTDTVVVPNLLVEVLHKLWYSEWNRYHQSSIFGDEKSLMYLIMLSHPELFMFVKTSSLFGSYLNKDLVYYF